MGTKYRIKKVSDRNYTMYIVEKKWLWFWEEDGRQYNDSKFYSFPLTTGEWYKGFFEEEYAKKLVKEYKQMDRNKKKVRYIK